MMTAQTFPIGGNGKAFKPAPPAKSVTPKHDRR